MKAFVIVKVIEWIFSSIQKPLNTIDCSYFPVTALCARIRAPERLVVPQATNRRFLFFAVASMDECYGQCFILT